MVDGEEFNMATCRDVSVVFYLWIVTSGASTNLALNKKAFMSSDAIQSDSWKTVDGDSATFGKFVSWLVIDLEKDYQIDEVQIQYLSWGGGGYVTVEFFSSNPAVIPSTHLTPKLCETHYCLAGNQLRSKTFTCQDQPRGRFIQIRRHGQDHPYFRVHKVTVTGSELGTNGCNYLMKKMNGTRMVTTLTPTQLQATTSTTCATTCKQQAGCEAFNFNHVTGGCEMLRSSVSDALSSHGDWSLAFYIYQ